MKTCSALFNLRELGVHQFNFIFFSLNRFMVFSSDVGIRNFPTLGMIVEGQGDRVSRNIDNCVY